MNKYILEKQIKLKHDELSDKHYVFCIESGDHYELNNTGYVILGFLSEKRSVSDIVYYITKNTNTEIKSARKDTIKFLNFCEKNGIIVKT